MNSSIVGITTANMATFAIMKNILTITIVATTTKNNMTDNGASNSCKHTQNNEPTYVYIYTYTYIGPNSHTDKRKRPHVYHDFQKTISVWEPS